MRAAVTALCVLLACGFLQVGSAHDLITPVYADKYLAMVTQYAISLKSTEPATKRAESAYQLGRLLDEIREFLNRDLATHGKVQGLASNQLILDLKARGAPLAQNAQGRFVANLSYYHDSLRLAPRGQREGDALFKLVQGYFYDSFDEDPLHPRNQSWQQLQDQIVLCERLLSRYPNHDEQEEALFITLIHYVQATRSTGSADQARVFADKARSTIADFERRYPASLRAAAMPVMRDALTIR